MELLVVGTPSCTSLPTFDLRGYYLDDNNGNHGTGAGFGIGQGCVRFSNNSFWNAISIGTIIVIYNDAEQNPSLPPQDLSMSDENCRLIIPISNCLLIEKNTSLPSLTNGVYPVTGFNSCGSWNNISMNNTDDSFQIIDPSGLPVFSISWGNNTINDIIYFIGSSVGMLAEMKNINGNNAFDQANWVRVGTAGNQTPGFPNNATNAAWIIGMNNSCTNFSPLSISVSPNVTICLGDSPTLSAFGATTFSWAPTDGLNMSQGASVIASPLSFITYTVTGTDENACQDTATVDVTVNFPVVIDVITVH